MAVFRLNRSMTPTHPRVAQIASYSEQQRRLRRWTGYALWSASAFALPLALERLVVCPQLQRCLGEGRFGAFIWLLDIMNLIAMASSAGFSNNLLRSLAATDPARGRAMVRMSLLLAVVIAAPVLVVGSVISYQNADEYLRAEALAICIPLAFLALFRCLGAILISPLRINRHFATIFVLKAIEGGVLSMCLLIAGWRNLAVIGGLYVASAAIPLALNAYLSRKQIGRGAWWSPALTKAMLLACVGLAAPALIEQSLACSPRIFLGALQGSATVTVLFAGTSIGNVFVQPVAMAGGLVLSLLASKKEFVLGGRRGYLYLGGAFGCASIVGCLSYLVGTWMIRLLYANVAAEAISFYHWIALANTATAGIVLIRPVAMKYARIRNVAGLSLATLLLQWLLLTLLIPAFGPAGAATALAFSSSMGLCLWVGCYLLLLRNPAAAAANLRLQVTEIES